MVTLLPRELFGVPRDDAEQRALEQLTQDLGGRLRRRQWRHADATQLGRTWLRALQHRLRELFPSPPEWMDTRVPDRLLPILLGNDVAWAALTNLLRQEIADRERQRAALGACLTAAPFKFSEVDVYIAQARFCDPTHVEEWIVWFDGLRLRYHYLTQWDFVHRFPGAHGLILWGPKTDLLVDASGGQTAARNGYRASYIPSHAIHPERGLVSFDPEDRVVVLHAPVATLRVTSWLLADDPDCEPEVVVEGDVEILDVFDRRQAADAPRREAQDRAVADVLWDPRDRIALPEPLQRRERAPATTRQALPELHAAFADVEQRHKLLQWIVNGAHDLPSHTQMRMTLSQHESTLKALRTQLTQSDVLQQVETLSRHLTVVAKEIHQGFSWGAPQRVRHRQQHILRALRHDHFDNIIRRAHAGMQQDHATIGKTLASLRRDLILAENALALVGVNIDADSRRQWPDALAHYDVALSAIAQYTAKWEAIERQQQWAGAERASDTARGSVTSDEVDRRGPDD